MPSPLVSVIIPSRNEQFLSKTVDDICAKAQGEIEVVVVLEGYWPPPEEMSQDKRVSYIHHPKARGLRASLNEGVAIAKGKFVMKVDAHCMFSPGFDVALSSVCESNWVCVPTRYRLDAEKWEVKTDHRPPINYLYINAANNQLDGKLWDQKNRDRDLDSILIDDIIACQGSVFFLPKAYWHELELLDEEHYGTFRKDPQEVMFKAWTYGGRCVRVKTCWYAHLHKGKKYGRGYRPSRTDWKKGDEYTKQWWTDSAWPKQKIPFREIIAKFPGMPGWDNHEWMKESKLKMRMGEPGSVYINGPKVAAPKEQKVKVPRPLRAYQYLEVDGVPLTKTPTNRRGSKFWGEGKWEHFIAPLLPEFPVGQTFIEMGCNAGLFLSLAANRGFGRIIGVEKNKTPYRAALKYRDALGLDYTVLKRTLGGKFGQNGSFDIDELPMADVTLLSNFHYHIDINAWYKYLDRLIAKTVYVLLVSTPDVSRYRWRVNSQMGYMDKYFRKWEPVAEVLLGAVSTDGDPKPRRMFSILYKSPGITRVPIDAVRMRQGNGFGHVAIQELTKRIAAGEQIDIAKTALYADWKKRKPRWSEKALRWFIQGKLDLIKSLIADGPKDPILVQEGTLRICDGGHRRLILKTLGHESVIVREV